MKRDSSSTVVVEEKRESLSTVVLDEKYIKPDIAVNEKYQNFSSEVLRLSLAGLGVFGFLFKNVFKEMPHFPKVLSGLAMVFFGIAAAAALCHRYFSSDAIACQIKYLRLWLSRHGQPDSKIEPTDEEDNEKQAWKRNLFLSQIAIGISSGLLAIAAIFLGVVFLYALSTGSFPDSHSESH
jgi:hypothetical protein